MGGDTRGQQLLPGDPESLLRATKPQLVAKNQGIRAYLALTITLTAEGAVEVRRLRLDSATRRVIPELLDSIEPAYAGALSLAETLRHWAQEEVLASWDVPL